MQTMPDISSSSQSTSTCPFAHLFGRKTGSEQITGSCPFARGPGERQGVEGGDGENGDKNGNKNGDENDREGRGSDFSREVGSKCPLGFTSNASSSQLSSMHCIVCKSLLFLPHTTPCGHTFCLHCATRSQSCVVCGDTVEEGSLTPNTHLQQTLEAFLQAHAGAVTFYDLYDAAELVAALKKQEHEEEEEEGAQVSTAARATAKATFFMTAGMASAMGGNEMAAWHWYWLARAAYLGHQGDVEVQKRLGILYGVMGDLNKSLGYDMDTVLECYARAISYLGDGLSDDPESREEYQRALSALLNKTGEVYHYNGDVQRALEYYAKALVVRNARLERLTAEPGKVPTEIEVSAKLDVVTSYAKVADAQGTLGMHAARDDSWHRGKRMINEVALRMNQVHLAHTHSTFDALRAFYDDT